MQYIKKISATFRRFPIIFQDFRRFPKTAEDFRRLPKMYRDYQRCPKTTEFSKENSENVLLYFRCNIHIPLFPANRGSFLGVRSRQQTPGKELLLAGKYLLHVKHVFLQCKGTIFSPREILIIHSISFTLYMSGFLRTVLKS